MRAIGLMLVLAVVPVATLRAEPTAAEVIERALAAHGGADKVAKLAQSVTVAKGKMAGPQGEMNATREVHVSLPGKARWKVELESPTGKFDVTFGYTPDKGWRRNFGQTNDMTLNEVSDVRDEGYVRGYALLYPLKGATVEGAIAGKLAAADVWNVKVTAKGKPDASLSFDQKSGLLSRIAFVGKDAGLRVTKEYLLSDYKEFEGVRLPTRYVEKLNGTTAGTWTVTQYRFPDKIDEALFTKP